MHTHLGGCVPTVTLLKVCEARQLLVVEEKQRLHLQFGP